MAPPTRPVLCSLFYPDGTPRDGDSVIYRLKQDSYTDAETIPKGDIVATADETGITSADLWPNADGLRYSYYEYTLPDSSTGTFVLPTGDNPITLEELRAMEDDDDWQPPAEAVWDARDAAIYAAFRNTSDLALGDALVGTKYLGGVGAIARTVHDKLNDDITTADFDTFGHAIDTAYAHSLTLLVNTAVTAEASITVPSNVHLAFIEPGSITVNGSDVLTVNGALTAGRFRIFSGAGTVDLSAARIEGVYPEWFGATGTSDDTAAFQAAADAHPVVIGDGHTPYLIQSDATLWSTKNLHRIKHGTPHASGWINGIWYGVRLSDNAEIRDCTIRVTRVSHPLGTYTMVNGVATLTTRTSKGTFAFAAGNPTHLDPAESDETIYATRGSNVTFANCRVEHFDFYGDAPSPDKTEILHNQLIQAGERYKLIVTQSLDGLTIENCDFVGTYERHSILPMCCFDSTNIRVRHNYFELVFCCMSLEFCFNVDFSHNTLWNSRQFCDLDARDYRIVIAYNTFDRETRNTDTDDAALELNGAQDVVIHGNLIRNAHRGVINSCKPDVYDTWAMVMAQSGTLSTVIWSNVVCRDNTWINLTWQGVLSGSNWNTRPHTGQLIGSGFTVEDTFIDCGYYLGSGDDHAIVQIYEGRGVRLNSTILNPSAIYTTVATAVTDWDTNDDLTGDIYSLVLDDATGFVVGEKMSVEYDTTTIDLDADDDTTDPGEAAPFKHHVLTITAVSGATVTFDQPLRWNVAAGNTVRTGSGGGYGVFARSFTEGDGVAAASHTLSQDVAAGASSLFFASTAGFVKGANITLPVVFDDGTSDIAECTILDKSTTKLTLVEALPGSAATGTTVTQTAAVGAGAASQLEIDAFGGRIEDTGYAGININKAGRVHFDGLTLRNTGRHDTPGNRRQAWIQHLEANYWRPDGLGVGTVHNLLPARITGSLDIEATIANLPYGILLQANDWTANSWTVDLDLRSVGHTWTVDGSRTAYDLSINDASGNNGETSNNIRLRGTVGTTNLNSVRALSIRQPLIMYASSYPTNGNVGNTAFAIGDLIYNTAAAVGTPMGWICVGAGRPGAWNSWGDIGAVPLNFTLTYNTPSDLTNSTLGTKNMTVTGIASGWPIEYGIAGLPSGDWETSARCTSTTNIAFYFRNRTGTTMPAGTSLTLYAIVTPYT